MFARIRRPPSLLSKPLKKPVWKIDQKDWRVATVALSPSWFTDHVKFVEDQARRFSRLEVPLCEEDDLIQVGLEKLWSLLQDEQPITHLALVNAMRDALRKGARATRLGYTGFNDENPPEILSLDELDDRDTTLVLLTF